MADQHPLTQSIIDQIPFSKASAALLNDFLIHDQERTDELRAILLYCDVYPKFSSVQKTQERLCSFKTELNKEIERLKSKVAEIERINTALDSLDNSHLMDPALSKRLDNAFAPISRMKMSPVAHDPSRLGLKRLPFRRVRYAVLLKGSVIQVFNTSLDVRAHKHCSEFIEKLSLITNQGPKSIRTLELPYQLPNEKHLAWVYERHYIKTRLNRYKADYRTLLTMSKTDNGWTRNEQSGSHIHIPRSGN